MRCPKCGKNVEFQKKKVGIDEKGNSILNEYAICRDCKKQWNLDKQKAPTGKTSPSSEKAPSTQTKAKPSKTQDKKVSSSNVSRNNTAPQKMAGPLKNKEAQYSNIPPERVRAKKETAVKQSYENMLAADPDRKPAVKKRKPAPKQSSTQKKPVPPRTCTPMKKDEPQPKFKAFRITMGILSITAFIPFTYKALMFGLNNIASGNNTSAGTVFIVLALCMLVSGLLLLIMQKKHTIFSFILPMIFYIGGAVFAFLNRESDKWLLFSAAAGVLLGIVFIILAIASRSRHEEDCESDYADTFEDND